MNAIWTYIKATKFFPKYCPNIKSWKHKLRGKNGRGNAIEFTESEKRVIKDGVKQLCNDLNKII